ncbi:MAG: hypothetical protein ACXWP0_13610, partial [Ktedonobacterales bacterium]
TMLNGMREYAAAQYPGKCAICGEEVLGQTILWRYGYTIHKACAPQPTAEELAAMAAEQARIEAEHRKAEEMRLANRQAAEEARKVAAKERAKARRIERKAEGARLMEEPIVRYDHGFDSRNSMICGRCGGTGRYSFNLMDMDRCYGCGGKGRVFKAAVAQPKVATTATLDTAKVGDVFEHGKTLYRVTAITWLKAAIKFMAPTLNQKVNAERLVDGDTAVYFRREAFKQLANEWNTPVVPSDAMIGKPAELDTDGQWLVY